MSSKRAAVLDRDGTLVDIVRDEETGVIVTAFHPDQLRILPGVVDGLRELAARGFVFAIATNQPGPAKGQHSRASVERTNAALVALFAAQNIIIEKVAVCMHHPDGGPGGDASLVGPCACRKPKPGMLLDLQRDMGFDFASSWMIGDQASDVDAGRAAHMRTGLIFDERRCELCPLRAGPPASPDLHARDLRALARLIVAHVGAAP